MQRPSCTSSSSSSCSCRKSSLRTGSFRTSARTARRARTTRCRSLPRCSPLRIACSNRRRDTSALRSCTRTQSTASSTCRSRRHSRSRSRNPVCTAGRCRCPRLRRPSPFRLRPCPRLRRRRTILRSRRRGRRRRTTSRSLDRTPPRRRRRPERMRDVERDRGACSPSQSYHIELLGMLDACP